MEVNGHLQILFEQTDQGCDPFRRDQTAHIFDGDHVGSQGLHFLSLFQEVGISKDLTGQFFTLQQRDQTFSCREMGVDRIADGTIGQSAIFFHIFDGRFHIIYIIQGIKDTHDTES